MKFPDSILCVTSSDGRPVAVQIPLEAWRRIESLARPVLSGFYSEAADSAKIPAASPEPVEAFEELLRYWDFRYPYSPAVRCPVCNTSAEDWRLGDPRPFRLVNANIGGLLVFRCVACYTTVRQKHFRDHVAFEHTTRV